MFDDMLHQGELYVTNVSNVNNGACTDPDGKMLRTIGNHSIYNGGYEFTDGTAIYGNEKINNGGLSLYGKGGIPCITDDDEYIGYFDKRCTFHKFNVDGQGVGCVNNEYKYNVGKAYKSYDSEIVMGRNGAPSFVESIPLFAHALDNNGEITEEKLKIVSSGNVKEVSLLDLVPSKSLDDLIEKSKNIRDRYSNGPINQEISCHRYIDVLRASINKDGTFRLLVEERATCDFYVTGHHYRYDKDDINEKARNQPKDIASYKDYWENTDVLFYDDYFYNSAACQKYVFYEINSSGESRELYTEYIYPKVEKIDIQDYALDCEINDFAGSTQDAYDTMMKKYGFESYEDSIKYRADYIYGELINRSIYDKIVFTKTQILAAQSDGVESKGSSQIDFKIADDFFLRLDAGTHKIISLHESKGNQVVEFAKAGVNIPVEFPYTICAIKVNRSSYLVGVQRENLLVIKDGNVEKIKGCLNYRLRYMKNIYLAKKKG